MHEEPAAQNEVSLREYLDLLRRRKNIIIQTFLAALVIGIAVALISRPVYNSTGRLLVMPKNPLMVQQQTSNDPLANLAISGQAHTIATQLEVLMTPDLLAKAYESAGVSALDPRVKVSVGRANDDVDIIDITVEAHKKDLAADVANNLMRLYIDRDKTSRTEDIDQAITYAKTQLKGANGDWQKASEKLDKYRQSLKVTDYAGQVSAANQAVALLEAKQDGLQSDIDGAQASIDSTKNALQTVDRQVVETGTISNSRREDLKRDLVAARASLAKALASFKPTHPRVIEAKLVVDSLQADLDKTPENIANQTVRTNPYIQELKGTLQKAVSQKSTLLASLATVQKQKDVAAARLKDLGPVQTKLAELQQESDLAQADAKSLSMRLSELELMKVAQPKSVDVLSAAQVNNDPIRPKRTLMILLATVAGLFLGVCFALLQEFLDDRVNAPEDARRVMGVPALGYIPKIDREDQRLLTADRAGGSVLESYRVLRSNVRFAAVGEPLNSIMVTSTAPGEGKSMTSCNLAIAMALDGKRVILVDADLRRPTVHEKFGVRNTPGLTNVLVGALPLEKALQDTSIENLQILTSGPIPPNPAELLNSSAMEQVQELLKQHADVVIYDTPPCLSVADAQVMAASVDGLIYVVQLGSTRKSALRHGYELLRQAQARVLGVVYNKVQVNNGRNDYYYGYYSYYHKAELPSKTNGNGNGQGKRRDEWDEMTSQTKDPASIASDASRTSRSNGDTGKSGSDKELS